MKSSCPFCSEEIANEIIAECGSVFAVYDRYPVTRGHALIIPKRHVGDYFQMSDEERTDSEKLIMQLKDEIKEKDSSVVGFNIGMNCGKAAGQTVAHGHIHLIPRRDGDVPDPRGGVRGVIPHMQRY